MNLPSEDISLLFFSFFKILAHSLAVVQTMQWKEAATTLLLEITRLIQHVQYKYFSQAATRLEWSTCLMLKNGFLPLLWVQTFGKLLERDKSVYLWLSLNLSHANSPSHKGCF